MAEQQPQGSTLAIIHYSLSIIRSTLIARRILKGTIALPFPLLLIILTACERPLQTTSPMSLLAVATIPVNPTPTLQSNIANGDTAVSPPSNQAITPLIPCSERSNSDDLTIYIDKQYYISPNYIPPDLVNVATYLPAHTLWGEQQLRRETAVALSQMVTEMSAQKLQPILLSTYRDYHMQAASYAKWQAEQPARADIISARPGSSEHQLGTTVDFGSPELARLVGPNIQFHQLFAQTSEGEWLANNAYRYGFTLSYPQDSFQITGYEYEPWHFRYIGIEKATALYSANSLLLAWQAENLPAPCVP